MSEVIQTKRDNSFLSQIWKAWKLLFGYDVFISYRSTDGSGYARRLLKRLEEEGLQVFLDQTGTPGGIRLRKHIRRNLLRSQSLVVLASPLALEEDGEITPEIEIFVGRHPRRALLGVQFSEELERLDEEHPWYPYFHHPAEKDAVLWHSSPNGRDDLVNSDVHDETIEYVKNSRTLLLRGQRARLLAWSILAIVVTFSGIGVVSVIQRLEEGQISLAQARGFEALDRSSENVLDGLVVAADSLSIRDSFAGRRAAMSFWSKTPTITAVNDLYLQSPLAIRHTEEGGLDVIGSGGFAVRLESDLKMPERALMLNPSSQTPNEVNQVTVATGAKDYFALGTSKGQIILFNQLTGEAVCQSDQRGEEITALSWLPRLDGISSNWIAFSSQQRNRRLTLRTVVQDIEFDIPISHPEQPQTILRLPGRNCLLVAGKDWNNDRMSVALLEIGLTNGRVNVRSESGFDDEPRFDIPPTRVSLEPPTGRSPSRFAAIIDDGKDKDCQAENCRALVFYSLPEKTEVFRMVRSDLSFVSFLPRERDEVESWVVVGDYGGSVWLMNTHSLLSGTGILAPVLESGSISATDQTWLNHQAIALAVRRPQNRFLLITNEGRVFEIALPSDEPRFGSRITKAQPIYGDCPRLGTNSSRSVSPALRRKFCQLVAGKVLTGFIAGQRKAWLFYPDRRIEVLDASGRVTASGMSPETTRIGPSGRPDPEASKVLSEIFDGIVSTSGNEAWAVRSDGALLHFSLSRSLIRAKEISYGNGPAPIIMGDLLVSFLPELSGQSRVALGSLASSRIGFDDSVGPVAKISIWCQPLAGIPIPNTELIFIVGFWKGDLAFELVDISRRRSVSQPVILAKGEDVWGASHRSVFLVEDPHPDLAKARLQYDFQAQSILLVTPAGHSFTIPMSRDKWAKDIKAIVKWVPELGAAVALGFDGDYPVRSSRNIDVKWTRECRAVRDADGISNFLQTILPSNIKADTFTGVAAAHGIDQFRELFPDDALGCPKN